MSPFSPRNKIRENDGSIKQPDYKYLNYGYSQPGKVSIFKKMKSGTYVSLLA